MLGVSIQFANQQSRSSQHRPQEPQSLLKVLAFQDDLILNLFTLLFYYF